MADDERSLELEVEVPGSPEEVWAAIATGPGISSWYVPHVVEEREGGEAVASFGPGPEMQVPGRVAAWEPPRRVVFDGGEGVDGLAFEWLIEARDSATCVVRLVNSGFGTGEEWDDQYNGMAEGWPLFLANLRLQLTHFPGQTATPMLPMATWPVGRDEAWETLLADLGLPPSLAEGDRLATSAPDAPQLVGVVAEVAPWRIAVLVEEPSPGTAFLTAEGYGEEVAVSVWSYLCGPAGAEAVVAEEPEWQEWLSRRASALGDMHSE